MKNKAKFFRNIALLLLPVLLYYIVFVIFEPNNYFGLKEKADGTDIMAILRQYEETPADYIIIGESRMAKIDPAIPQEITGNDYFNLAFGGASLKEQLDILDWAREQNPDIKEVVFMLSFYNLNKSYNQDRMVIRALNNPLIYMTNLGYNINMLTNIYDHLSPDREVGGHGETENPDDYRYVHWQAPGGQVVSVRETIANHLDNLVPRSENWQLNDEQFQRLLETIADCEASGIRVVVALPPASAEVMLYIVDAFNISGPMQDVTRELTAAGALVLDYESGGHLIMRPDQFFDGFHLDIERGMDEWTEMLFTDISLGYRRDYPIVS